MTEPQSAADYFRQQNGAEPVQPDIFAGCDWPRHYAAVIDGMQDADARRAALEMVPEEWRELVKRHVINTRGVRKARREHLRLKGEEVVDHY